MKIKNHKDFYAGLMFTVTGGAFAVGATAYSVGTAARMGPGYFPLLLGVVLALLGLAILFNALVLESEHDERVGPWAWRPLGYIIGANLAFGVLLGGLPSIGLPAMGLVVAIVALTFLASMAGPSLRLLEVLALAAVLCALSYVAFIWLLKLQIPVWPSFIGG